MRRCIAVSLLVLVSVGTLHAAVTEAWRLRFEATRHPDKLQLATDPAGNLFVLTDTMRANRDVTLAKYSAAGPPLWVRHYNGNGDGDDYAAGLVIDAHGNIFVAARGGPLGDGNFVAIKYDASGNEVWVSEFDSPVPVASFDAAVGIGLDAEGNVYVGGFTLYYSAEVFQLQGEYVVLKLDASGNRSWVLRYSPATNSFSPAVEMAVDAAGNTFLTGYSSAFSPAFEFLTIKVNSAGAVVWASNPEGEDEYGMPAAIGIDPQGNVFVAGDIAGDFGTQKIGPSGETEWIRTYASPPYHENIRDLAVDRHGNVYVTGPLSTDRLDCDDDSDALVTLKYDAAGNLLWVQRYDGLLADGCNQSYPGALTLDDEANLYVTATSAISDTEADWLTFKYDTDGQLLWTAKTVVARFSASRSIALGLNRSIYVGAFEYKTNGIFDALVIKYEQANAAPVADASLTRNVVIAGNGTSANVTLNGSASTDADGDVLQYSWYRGGALIATGEVAVVTLSVGTHELELRVTDGQASDSDFFTLRVITPCQAIGELSQRVQQYSRDRTLLVHLRKACDFIESGHTAAGIHQLQLFRSKVLRDTSIADPAVRRELARAAQEIINAVNAATSPRARR